MATIASPSTPALPVHIEVTVTILWAIALPVHLYISYLFLFYIRSTSRPITVVEVHERLRDWRYLLSRLISTSFLTALLSVITWSQQIQLAWEWIEDLLPGNMALISLIFVILAWGAATLYGFMVMLSEERYLFQLHPAFFCPRCGTGWRRLVGCSSIKRSLRAEGPAPDEVEHGNRIIYEMFGGEVVDGKLDASLATSLVEEGKDCEWLYGYCNSHWDAEYGRDDEETQMAKRSEDERPMVVRERRRAADYLKRQSKVREIEIGPVCACEISSPPAIANVWSTEESSRAS